MATLRERFEAKVELGAPTECWIWTGSLTDAGYGQIANGSGSKLAHRVAYELYVGPIPDGRQLDHLCRNRACVNPTHLEPVTNATNTQRGSQAKITMADARRIRAMRRRGQTYRQIAENLGGAISQQVVEGIAKGVRWREQEFVVPDTFRQSLVATFDDCSLATKFELEGYTDWSSRPQGRGTLFHRVADEVVRTLHRTGETEISTQEAVEILYEVCRQTDVAPEDVIVLDAHEREMLLRTTLAFAALKWKGLRILGLEDRLETPILCEDGKTRTITGKLDVLLADPPGGAVVIDYKTGWGPAKDARGDAEPVGRQYLSERGHFQLDVYGLLVMRTYPAVERVTLREHHVMVGATREATLSRDELEHVEREIAVQLELLERSMLAGPDSAIWKPSPGRHCLYCPRSSACPIEPDARGEGAIDSQQAAERWAELFQRAQTIRDDHRAALKARVDETGQPIPAGRGLEVGYKTNETTGRKAFGIFPVGTCTQPKAAA